MASSEWDEILEAARADEQLSAHCDSIETLHARLKELSDALIAQDDAGSAFAMIPFEGTWPNPVYTPNAFKACKSIDGKDVAAFYRYAVKDEDVARKAAAARNRTSSSSNPRPSLEDDDRRRSSDVRRVSSTSFSAEGVVSGPPSTLIERIVLNDPELLGVDFTKQAVVQMKPDEKIGELCDALSENSIVETLVLKECGLGDVAVGRLGEFLSTNSSITYVDLSANPLKEDGAIALARGLATNSSVKELNLMGMLNLGKSERVLNAFVDMYQTNFTLKKIVWRLDHPLANTLARLMTRNNSIARRISQGKPYDDLLPAHMRAEGAASPNTPEAPVPPIAE